MPRAGWDRSGALVEERERLARDVEAVARFGPRQAELVPEAARQADPVQTCGLDVSAHGEDGGTESGFFAELGVVGRVDAVFVRHDPSNTGVSSGVDELDLGGGAGGAVQRDYEGFLACEGGDEGGVRCVVDVRDAVDARWDGGGAVGAGDGGDCVLALGDQGLGDALAKLAARADDGNLGDVVSGHGEWDGDEKLH